MESSRENKKLTSPVRWVLLCCGVISVALGVIGIFLPVLPTVPFLLLATACFMRSSDRFYTWLLEHAHLGPMITPYLDGHGLRKTSKVKAIVLIWVSITLSIYWLRNKIWLQGVLLVIALGVSIYLIRLPTLKSEDP